MPGSYRTYAIDFDGDGRPDLWQSPADIVGSVANYLARHDWQPGKPVLLPATIAEETRDAVLRKLDGGLSERRAADAWAADGVTLAVPQADAAGDPVGLLLLEESVDGVEVRATGSRSTISTCSRATTGAGSTPPAVHELAKAIRQAARGEVATLR